MGNILNSTVFIGLIAVSLVGLVVLCSISLTRIDETKKDLESIKTDLESIKNLESTIKDSLTTAGDILSKITNK